MVSLPVAVVALQLAQTDASASTRCSSAAEIVTRSCRPLSAFVTCGGIPAVLTALQLANDSEPTLHALLRIINNCAQSGPEYLRALTAANAVDILLPYLTGNTKMTRNDDGILCAIFNFTFLFVILIFCVFIIIIVTSVCQPGPALYVALLRLQFQI